MLSPAALLKRTPLARLALAIALGTLGLPGLQSNAHAHGGAAEMVPLQSTLEAFGATVKWDDYADVFVIAKDGAYLKVKPDSKVAVLNGKRMELTVPVVFKGKTAFMSKDFINQVFQSGLDKTFVIETRPSPLNPLSADEINTAVEIIKTSGHYKPGLRFTEISVYTPPKDQVWNFIYTGQKPAQPRQANIVVLDGKHVIEGQVDLDSKTLLSWKPIEGAHGMVLLDDFATVQSVIDTSPEYAQALAKRGITDIKKVVTTPLTVGYFDGKDGLTQDKRLLKIVSYLDVGDGNYWAHPIEGLVAVVDLEQKKLIKV
ncbi:stalk domain-containing protein, partial [Pseudomonas helleri]